MYVDIGLHTKWCTYQVLLVYMGKFTYLLSGYFSLTRASLAPPHPPVALSLGPHAEFKNSPCHLLLRSPCRSLYSIKRQMRSPLFLKLCSKNKRYQLLVWMNDDPNHLQYC